MIVLLYIAGRLLVHDQATRGIYPLIIRITPLVITIVLVIIKICRGIYPLVTIVLVI